MLLPTPPAAAADFVVPTLDEVPVSLALFDLDDTLVRANTVLFYLRNQWRRGLPTELHTRGEPSIAPQVRQPTLCAVRGPPGELFPWDVSETGELLFKADEGPPVDAVAYDLPLFADDLAA